MMEIYPFKKIYSLDLNKEYIKIQLEKIKLQLRLNDIDKELMGMPKFPDHISEWIDSLPEAHADKKSFSLANFKKFTSFKKEVVKIDSRILEIESRTKIIEIEDLIERARNLSEG
jgi:hypothetical protein